MEIQSEVPYFRTSRVNGSENSVHGGLQLVQFLNSDGFSPYIGLKERKVQGLD